MSPFCFVYPNKLSVVWCCAFSFCRTRLCAESVEARVLQFICKYFINADEEARKKSWKTKSRDAPSPLTLSLDSFLRVVHTPVERYLKCNHAQTNLFSCLQDMSVTFLKRCTYLLSDRNVNLTNFSKTPTKKQIWRCDRTSKLKQ